MFRDPSEGYVKRPKFIVSQVGDEKPVVTKYDTEKRKWWRVRVGMLRQNL